jgi:hypothetical protein
VTPPPDKTKIEIERLQRLTRGLLVQHRMMREQLTKRVAACEQAILELDSAFRRSGVAPDGNWVLSLRPSEQGDPDRQSADDPSRISP